MLSKLVVSVSLALCSLFPTNIGTAANAPMTFSYVLPEVVVTAKPFKTRKTFMGFNLLGRCDVNVSSLLKEALTTFPGPKVRITSLRRNWNSNSQHNHGKAVDMEWSEELIDFLVTEEGSTWLSSHNMMFYIEDRPGSVKLRKYKQDPKYSEFVFENPHATGPHVHLGLKR